MHLGLEGDRHVIDLLLQHLPEVFRRGLKKTSLSLYSFTIAKCALAPNGGARPRI